MQHALYAHVVHKGQLCLGFKWDVHARHGLSNQPIRLAVFERCVQIQLQSDVLIKEQLRPGQNPFLRSLVKKV